MRKLTFLFSLLLLVFSTIANEPLTKKSKKFSFAFLTDIHLNKSDNGCFEGLNQAIKNARSEKVDFILTGGDNVDIDVLKNDDKTAHELYQKYAEIIENSGIEYYATLGNHDRFWGCKKSDPLYNEGLFEKYINKSYYSFDYMGWHFVVLNTTQSCGGSYCVGDEQKEWLKNDIEKLDPETPIIVSCHVPFLSVYYPALEGKYKGADTFANFKEIWDMFNGHNLKLVLQGHQHLYEEIQTLGVQFITGGAVSARWWGGDYHGTQEGYLKVNINGNEFDWEYIDYGWEAKKK